ncbi:lactonase family protein [Vagococcus vulneris]|uniref:6-phosphogluconolactonase n=1 Tax=Vagococcus vulneris TaxID=1977869 RepID=A0A429ZWV7_9ENTE|nr:lactonase family protein [Vagococcus vulneris]RST98205.1 hypothetical protein CBF37_08530 [Vagococcus vulneris]
MTKKILLGSYTRRESQGIYTIDLNNQILENLSLLIKEDNPTYLDTTDNYLYSVTKDGEKGGISAYTRNPDGNLTFINKVTAVGAPPCYVAVDNKRQLVYGANYHQGILKSYRILKDGGIELADTIQHEGTGPHENQDGPHAHYIDLTPDHRLAACDLGNDTVYTYDVSDDGHLTEAASFNAQPGCGPRHLIFHPNKEIAYLFGELSSDVFVLRYDKSTGAFTQLQAISTLPEDYNDFNGGAAIRISKDGKFVYVSNRGHNSIAVFKTDNQGEQLSLIQHISVEGDFPRDFNLSPDETHIVVANQNSDNLTLFSRDTESGKLTLLQKDVYAPEVVCVKFV